MPINWSGGDSRRNTSERRSMLSKRLSRVFSNSRRSTMKQNCGSVSVKSTNRSFTMKLLPQRRAGTSLTSLPISPLMIARELARGVDPALETALISFDDAARQLVTLLEHLTANHQPHLEREAITTHLRLEAREASVRRRTK